MSALTLRNGAHEYQLCRYQEECGPKQVALPFADAISALYFLRELITDSDRQHELRLWLVSHNASFEMYSLDDDNILEYTARLLASGQLLIAGAAEGGGAEDEGEGEGIIRKGGAAQSILLSHVETTPLQDEMATSEETASSEEEEAAAASSEEESAVTRAKRAESTWIEIELYDMKGRPVPNERFKITMPDGTVMYGRLDDDARAKIEKLQPGTCEVTFPDRDEEVWEIG